MQIFDSFLAFKSDNTKRSYEAVISAFFGDEAAISAISATDVVNYLAELKASGAAPSTVRHHYNVLRSLFAYAVDMGIVENNPAAAAKRVLRFNDRKQVRPTKLIPFDDVSKIIDGIKPYHRTQKSNYDAVRDKALLAALFGSGLRRSEAAALTLADVEPYKQHPYFNITSPKAGVAQRAIISNWAWVYLCRWIILRYRQSSRLSGALFSKTSASGEYAGSICAYTVYRIYKRRLFEAGFDAAPHSARATAATKALREGHDVLAVAEFLRHGDIKRVSVYDKRRSDHESKPDLSY